MFRRLLSICCAALALVSLFACTPAADAGSEIADFDLPAGFAAEFSTSAMGYTVATYRGPNAASHLYLIQSEKEADGEELARMLTQLAPGSPDNGVTAVENRTVTLRGQEVNLTVAEGLSSENVAYRQIMAVFEGKGGPALLVLSESVEAWDQEAVDAFLASIR